MRATRLRCTRGPLRWCEALVGKFLPIVRMRVEIAQARDLDVGRRRRPHLVRASSAHRHPHAPPHQLTHGAGPLREASSHLRAHALPWASRSKPATCRARAPSTSRANAATSACHRARSRATYMSRFASRARCYSTLGPRSPTDRHAPRGSCATSRFKFCAAVPRHASRCTAHNAPRARGTRPSVRPPLGHKLERVGHSRQQCDATLPKSARCATEGCGRESEPQGPAAHVAVPVVQ